jgi:integrase/recombinase XerD
MGASSRASGPGNWLLRDQANELLNAPDPTTLKGKRDRAILALLVGCGLRRAELPRLSVENGIRGAMEEQKTRLSFAMR